MSLVDRRSQSMRTRMRFLGAGVMFATALAVGLGTGQAAGSSNGGSSRTEHFTFMSTAAPTGETFSAIATGAFTDGGSATLLTKTGKLILRNGTINVTEKQGKPIATANTKTCYEHLSDNGTYKIIGGTGRYKGITGSGKFTLSIREIGPLVHGKCDTKTAKRVAGQAFITASGPVTLG
jgi:hypothetical protein